MKNLITNYDDFLNEKVTYNENDAILPVYKEEDFREEQTGIKIVSGEGLPVNSKDEEEIKKYLFSKLDTNFQRIAAIRASQGEDMFNSCKYYITFMNSHNGSDYGFIFFDGNKKILNYSSDGGWDDGSGKKIVSQYGFIPVGVNEEGTHWFGKDFDGYVKNVDINEISEKLKSDGFDINLEGIFKEFFKVYTR
jgi:hypothetical protein